jgi:hypothetical protein
MTYNSLLRRVISDAVKLGAMSRAELFIQLADEYDDGGWNSRTEAKRMRAKILRQLKSELQLFTNGQLIGLILEERFIVEEARDVEIDSPLPDPVPS